jgi:hypothetical protein
MLARAGAVLSAFVATACVEPAQRPVQAIPAARNGESRPLRLLPPVELLSAEEAADDAIVRIVSEVSCTGTLVADDLVLTAHHCVSARDSDGHVLPHDVEPSSISVELGKDYFPWGEVTVRAIVSPDCGYASGEGDIAILVLSRRLIGMPTINPRLETEPKPGETVEPVGFGRCAISRDAIKRVRRVGGIVDSVRAGSFVAPASICPGDSGGPVRSQSMGDVLGVVSASVMDYDDRTSGPSVFTRLDVWRHLFSAAREIASGASPSELPPYRSCGR